MEKIQYRWMSRDEVQKIAEIDRAERIRTGYEMRDGQLHKMRVNWDAPPWFPEGHEEHSINHQIDFARRHLGRGGKLYGAFDGELLVGVGILTPDIRPGMDQLAFLHVSRKYRRLGIGRQIVNTLLGDSTARGTAEVYVTATPSGSAVGFYQDFGFKSVEEPLSELYELEPEDIHMMLTIRKLKG